MLRQNARHFQTIQNSLFRNSSTIDVSFIRHGQTEMNLKSIVQGHADSSLTSLGIEQASSFGKSINKKSLIKNNQFEFTDAFCSDLGRTRQTINAILENAGEDNKKLLTQVVYTKKLRERNYGEGVDGVWSVEKYLNEAENAGLPPREYEPPGKGIEKLEDLEKRGLDFLESDILASDILATGEKNKHILVVTHAIFLREMFWLLDNRFGIKGTENL
jgi:broad specificity phosphatase PhoE